VAGEITANRPPVQHCGNHRFREGDLPPSIALQWRMPELTRRRSSDAREECWHVYRGDICAGTIEIRSGVPFDEDPWGWTCGFSRFSGRAR